MPAHGLSERAALAAHFDPGQLAADRAHYTPAEVWDRHVRIDNSARLAHYRPHEELSQAELTCRFVIPADAGRPTALADLGPSLSSVRSGTTGCKKCRRSGGRTDPATAAAGSRSAGFEPLEPYPGKTTDRWRCRCGCSMDITLTLTSIRRGRTACGTCSPGATR